MTARSDLDVHIRGRDELSPELQKIESRLIRFVGAVSSALTAVRVASFPIRAVREFEAGMADVQKTTGFTDREIKKLGNSLTDLSRRINILPQELAAIAAAAGQQGLGREGVEGVEQFTESVSRMAAVLDLTVEDAGSNIGKIASIFRIPLRDIERAVSAINEVSNNSTASGEQLLDVIRRIGDAAGSLNMAQVTGVAATGIDLGLSPEVVGTSFSKIFSEMYSQADKFSALLGTSVNDWINRVQENGVQALRDYLTALRGLTPQAQQQMIKELSGGGRIGNLVTKLVQDVDNVILDRNVAYAEEGFTKATSAIREQQTVLETLDAGVVKLSNSFEVLGIKAGERFAGPLTAYLAQLTEALGEEEVVRFAEAVGDSFLRMFEAVAAGVKFVHSLNVEWGNFITAAKLFAGLKLAQVMGSLLLSVTGVSRAYESLSGSAAAAARMEESASKSRLALALGLDAEAGKIKALIAQRTAYIATIREQAQAEQAHAAAQQAVTAAEMKRMKAANDYRRAQEELSSRGGASINAARSAAIAAETRAAAQVQQIQATHNAKLEQAEIAHAARRQAIEQERIDRQAVARAAGNRSEMLAATRDRNAKLEAEQAYYERSLRGINGYYNRRIQAIQAAGAQEVAAAKLAFMHTLSAFDGEVQSPGMAQLRNSAKEATEELGKADLALAQATTRMTASQVAAQAASKAYSAMATGVRILGTALSGLIRVLGVAMFWLTLLYTVAQSLGITGAIASGFQKLTDGLGITSQASRDLAREQQALADTMKATAERADEAREALRKYFDVLSGRISSTVFEDINKALGSDSPAVRSQGMEQLIEVLQGLSAQEAVQEEVLENIPKYRENLNNEIALIEEDIEKARKRLEAAQASLLPDNMVTAFTADIQASSQAKVVRAQAQIESLLDVLAKKQKELASLSTEMERGVADALSNVGLDFQEAQKIIADFFTEESATVFSTYAPLLAAAKQAEDEATAIHARIAAEQAKSVEDISEADKKVLEEALFNMEVAKQETSRIVTEMGQTISNLKAEGGLSDAIIGSLDDLGRWENASIPLLQRVLTLIKSIKEEGGQFTGTLAPPPRTPASGEDEFDTESESELRRIRRARLELARAHLEAEAKLQRDANDRKLADDEHFYQEGELSLRRYFERRADLQRQGIDIELRLKRQEIDALNRELAEAEQESERLRLQSALVRARGEIALLQQQRKAVASDTDRALQIALRDFADRVQEEKQALIDYFGAGTGMDAFEVALASGQAQYRQFLSKLRAEAEGNKDLLQLIDLTEARLAFEAVEAGLQSIAREAAVTQGAFDLVNQRLTMLRDNGYVTRQAFVALSEMNRRAVIGVMRAELEQSKARLEQLRQQELAAGGLTTRYREMELDIARQALALETLEKQANDTAKRIDDSLRGGVEDFLLSITTLGSDETLVDAFRNLVLSVFTEMRQVAAEGLADMFMNYLKSSAGGGLGDMFAKLTGASADTAEALRPDELRGTEALPMIVKDVSGVAEGVGNILGGGLFGGGEEAAGKVAEATEGQTEVLSEGLGQVTSGISGSIMGMAQTVGSALMSGLGSVGQLFMTVGQMIVAAITSSAAASSVGAIGGAAAAHTGGIVGRLSMRKGWVHPSAFIGALKYHTGGVAGLSPDEVPTILKKGEEVLTEDDPRHRNNLGGDSGGKESMAPTIFDVHPVLSEGAVLDVMAGAAGRKLLLVHIGKNPGAFRQALQL